jgi:two-component system response regulator AtoC
MPAEKILVIDDERLVRWSLRQKCEEWGYHVVEAAAGEPGLHLVQHESPDLVLLDVRLPDLNGIQVLEQLKKTPDAPAVIMITADPQLDDVKSALKLGAYDFVGTHWKPPGCAPKFNPCAVRCAATPDITRSSPCRPNRWN